MKMKKVVIAVVALGCVASVFIGRSHAPVSQPIVTKKAPDSLSKILKEPSTQVLPLTTKADEPRPSEECAQLWQQLARLDLNANTLNVSKQDIIPSPTVCKSGVGVLDQMQANYAKACEPFLNAKSDPKSHTKEMAAGCVSAIYFYRSVVTDWLTRDQKIEDIRDRKILLEKLLATTTRVDFKQMTAIADRLLELSPDLISLEKLSMLGKIALAATDKGKNADLTAWDHAQDAYNRARRDYGDDKEVAEASIFLKTKGLEDMEGLEAQANLLTRNPATQGIGFYYLASREWKAGNAAGAIDLLNRAVASDPTEERFKQTLADAQKGPSGKSGIFSFNVKTNFNFDEN